MGRRRGDRGGEGRRRGRRGKEEGEEEEGREDRKAEIGPPVIVMCTPCGCVKGPGQAFVF